MGAQQSIDLEPYLEHLRALPFVKRVDVRLPDKNALHVEDARLALHTPKQRHDFAIQVRAKPLSRRAAHSLVAHPSPSHTPPRLTFSPYVSRQAGEILASHHIGFVDRAGNCHVRLGEDYIAHIEGRKSEPQPRQGRGLGARSYQLLFTLLARPELVNAPVRSLAETAGVRKTTAAELLWRLKDEGFILRDTAGFRLARPGVLLDRWVAGYADKLRPRLLIGRYRAAARELSAFEASVETFLAEAQWAWGGATAGYRLTKHYRSPITTLHLMAPLPAMQRQFGLLPAQDGPIVVLSTPGPLGLDGPLAHVAHPLLVYTELLIEGGERAREAAEEIRARFLDRLA